MFVSSVAAVADANSCNKNEMPLKILIYITFL